MKHRIVYIINFWYGYNYGASLTAYALQNLISDLGYDVYLLDNRKIKTKFIEKKYYADNFINTNLKIKKFKREKDAILITGSDQVFNPNCVSFFHQTNLLNFAGFNNRKIAFSASFGVDKEGLLSQNPQELIDNMKNSLKTFDFISIREQSGIEICKDVFDVNAECIIDPVFIFEKEKWNKLLENRDKNFPKKLESNKVVSYILGKTKEHDKMYRYFSDKYKTGVLEFGEFKYSPEDWLYAIKNCELLVTNSYHAVCFAIIFHKPFICIYKDNGCATRFESLFKTLGIKNQSVCLNQIYEKDCVFKVDYIETDKKIAEEKERAKEFLLRSLKSESQTTNEKTLAKIITMENYVKELEKKCTLNFQLHNFLNDIWQTFYFCCLPKPIRLLIRLIKKKGK